MFALFWLPRKIRSVFASMSSYECGCFVVLYANFLHCAVFLSFFQFSFSFCAFEFFGYFSGSSCIGGVCLANCIIRHVLVFVFICNIMLFMQVY